MTVANAGPFTDLVVDDSGDPQAEQATLLNNGMGGQITGSSPDPLATLLGTPTYGPFARCRH